MNDHLKALLITISIYVGIVAFASCLVMFPKQLLMFVFGVLITLVMYGTYIIVLDVIKARK